MTSTMRFDTWENPAATKTVTFDQLVGGTGLVPMVPTNVGIVGGSASTNAQGLVSFSGVASINLEGVFTNEYRYYRVMGSVDIANTLAIKFLSGSIASGVNYNWAGYYSQAGSFGSDIGSNQGYFTGAWYNGITSRNAFTIDLIDPQIAANTFYFVETSATDRAQARGGCHTVATAYDGLQFFGLSGTLSGNIAVYGFNS